MGYVELHAHSAYSFLGGASLPEELAIRAAEVGYGGLALTDHDAIYGSLEFAQAAKAFGVRPITGAEVTLADGSHVTLLVESAAGYANLCRLLTAAHAGTRIQGKERELLEPALEQAVLEQLNEGLVCLSGCARHGLGVRNPNAAAPLAQAFGRDRFFVELQRPFERGDARRNAVLRELAETLGVATVATGDVHAHDLRLTALQDALVAVKNRTSLDGCEAERRGNRESFLRPPALGGARAGAGAGSRGARPQLTALVAAAGSGPRQLRRLDRLLPDRALPRRSGRGGALARPLPQPRHGRGARHRSRLPARHPGEAAPGGQRQVRARARRARRRFSDLQRARRDPRRRQGPRPAARGARAVGADHRRQSAASCGGGGVAAGCGDEAPLAPLARVLRALS